LETYVASLLETELPFGPWAVASAWVVLFIANHWVVRSLRVANEAQHAIGVEDWSAIRRGSQPKSLLAQFIFASVVFLCALFLGGPAYVFFAGGLVVAMAFVLALNLQGLFSARALAQANAANGALTFSTEYAFRHTAHRMAGGALASFVLGLLVGHIALLGGALILGSTAAGLWRRARSVSGQP
jgi:hypothetical protein